jgi:hypothetical protein
LVLVDAGLEIPSELVLHLAGYNGVKAPLPAMFTDADHNIDHIELVLLLFDHYTVQSVFGLPESAAIDCLLASTVCQNAVTTLEAEFLWTRTLATQASNEEAFKLLTNLRHHIITAHEQVSSTRASVNSAVLQIIEKSISRQAKSEKGVATGIVGDHSSHATAGASSTQPDVNNLPSILKELDDRLRDIIAAMNDEIQIVIGSVQLEDAKAMRQQADLTMRLTESTMQQTKIAMRQTKWTVALALLAALYLPMTLVTGIYGMNIKEISGDKGPSWWWVVVTWVLTTVITVGIFGRYAFVEWRRYQEEASKNEIASKQHSTEGGSGEKGHRIVAVADDGVTGSGCLPVLRVKPHWRRRPKMAQPQADETTV